MQVKHVLDVAENEGPSWLVQSLWGVDAVGFLGGQPKLGKTWLALELALAVSAGAPALGRFETAQGPVLYFPAEDRPADCRERLEALGELRGVALVRELPLFLLDGVMDLRSPRDCQALGDAVQLVGARLVVLDPFVRLHAGDENSSADVALVLTRLRTLQRKHAVAVMVVHHVRKSGGGRPGQALRGSSELHAWGDSNLYLTGEPGRVDLQAEHRRAAGGTRLRMSLLQGGGFALGDEGMRPRDAVLSFLREGGPASHRALRAHLRVRAAKVTDLLAQLADEQLVTHGPDGYELTARGHAVRST